MPTTLFAAFETRRDAEMTVETLVQELGIDRTQVFVAPLGADNSAGTEKAGSDTVEGEPDPAAAPALDGRIEVSVDLNDEAQVDAAEAVFRTYNVQEVNRR